MSIEVLHSVDITKSDFGTAYAREAVVVKCPICGDNAVRLADGNGRLGTEHEGYQRSRHAHELVLFRKHEYGAVRSKYRKCCLGEWKDMRGFYDQ